MQSRLIPNWMFSSASWLLLLAAMVSVALVSVEIYQRHLIPQAVQRFSFGSVGQSVIVEKADLSQVAQQHIFGVVPPVKKPVVEKPKVVEAPKTRLKLKLTGVIIAPVPEESRAMIEIKRGETSVVRVEEEIGKTGATLKSVFKSHILIERKGRPEKLEIVRPEMSLTDLRSQKENTITALNINVAEFEALAKVDPRDVDITALLPPPKPVVEPNVQAAEGDEQIKKDPAALDKISLRQIQELEALDRQEEIQELERILQNESLEQSEIEEIQNELNILRSQ